MKIQFRLSIIFFILFSISINAQNPGEIKKIGEVEFVWIPGGSFIMGSDSAKQRNERPQHKVTVNGFWMSRYEITQKVWESITGETIEQKRDEYDHLADLKGKGPNLPMYYISWNDVQKFCKKFEEKTGIKVRLPTEAEWEYACRAGSTTEYYWGDDISEEYAWWSVNANGTVKPVGSLKPNAWGLYDMSGNLYEWCEDWYSSTYYRISPELNPKGPPVGRYKVIRGGCFWNDYHICLRSAYRFNEKPHCASFYIGFRIVADSL